MCEGLETKAGVKVWAPCPLARQYLPHSGHKDGDVGGVGGDELLGDVNVNEEFPCTIVSGPGRVIAESLRAVLTYKQL